VHFRPEVSTGLLSGSRDRHAVTNLFLKVQEFSDFLFSPPKPSFPVSKGTSPEYESDFIFHRF